MADDLSGDCGERQEKTNDFAFARPDTTSRRMPVIKKEEVVTWIISVLGSVFIHNSRIVVDSFLD
jgi:hypothetical protein